MITSIREMNASDVDRIVDYFMNADADYLSGMGADKSKLPARTDWIRSIKDELDKPFEEKSLYYVIWQVDGEAIGHSNINNITFGKEAFMHLHIWEKKNRRFGNGLDLVRLSIPKYFQHFELETLRCEPYAFNPAPVKVLETAGFEYKNTYETTPSIICSPQQVKRYEMSKSQFIVLNLKEKK
ncbi:MAG: GNAT family protein [Reichenbachiella sp.]|uniref:GNAT family N-acetyltransferase n=1 Tax=Reichenbachiella sp. TaxID=2184521 RepID=UPI0032645112